MQLRVVSRTLSLLGSAQDKLIELLAGRTMELVAVRGGISSGNGIPYP